MIRLRYPVVLASASPRRQELLRRLVAEFDVLPADLDESPLPEEDPAATAQRLARDKALAVFERRPDALVIAGDTVVALPSGAQLAKPESPEQAESMLASLSGAEHSVITGLALRWPKGLRALAETTRVRFRTLSADEIRAYVATGEPMDKAGAYAIQGGAKGFVERVEGSVSNVVGLPLEVLEDALKEVK